MAVYRICLGSCALSTSILRLHDLLLTSAALLLALLLAASVKAQEEPIELTDDPFEISDPIAAAPGSAEAAFVGVLSSGNDAVPSWDAA